MVPQMGGNQKCPEYCAHGLGTRVLERVFIV